MTLAEINEKLEKQKKYFSSGITLPIALRKAALRKLLRAMERHEAELAAALMADLGKCREEAYMCEIGLVKSEIRYLLRSLDGFAAEKRVKTPIVHFPAKSVVKPVPYGTVLVMAPWNYPVLLSLEPLADAIAAGNTVILKPSAYAPATADALEAVISETFHPEYVTVIKGGRAENSALLDCAFDYIFFTGSKDVGKLVMSKAAEKLIPVTLELGGKSPCIVDETADIPLAARRIVFGKFINCGQTCVAPDYIYCAESVKDSLIVELRREIARQYGPEPLKKADYGKIVNEKHFRRILGLIDKDKTVIGGGLDEAALRIEPTVMDGVTWDDPVMGEEIFGPVLPILTYSSLKAAAEKINSMETPMALYHFSENKEAIRYIRERVKFGGGCVNDCLVHLATSEMGFGGMGESGMGSYHGRDGFNTFSHMKSILHRSGSMDLPMRYRPYDETYYKLIRFFLK